jgi:hypothetical protein
MLAVAMHAAAIETWQQDVTIRVKAPSPILFSTRGAGTRCKRPEGVVII